MKNFIFLGFVAVFVSGCLAIPKNRADFVKLSESQGVDSNKLSVVINKPLSYVNRRLAYLSNKCLNKNIVMSSRRGFETSRIELDYLSSFKRVNKNKSELTIRTSTSTLIGSKQSTIIFTADVTPLARKKTKLRINKVYGYNHFVGIVKKSASGKMKGCPANIHQ